MGIESLFGLEETEAMEVSESKEMLEEGVIREIIGSSEIAADDLENVEVVFGNPEDAENWHMQTEQNSCAIACQEFVAEQLLDREFSEQELSNFAEKQDWYVRETGTSRSDVGNLLEMLGLVVERVENCTIGEILQSLDDGEKIICAVNNMVLAEPRMAEMPGLKANHVVELIGIDCSDPEKVQVILNDPGVKNGQAIRHDMDVFLKAWETGENYAVIAGKGEVR